MNNNTLLALLLGLHHLEGELTSETKSSLKRLVGLFEIDDDWEDIQKQLDSILANNAALNQAYQTAQKSLEAVNSDILSDLLPNQDELNQIIPSTGERGYFPGQDDGKSNEILNIGKIVANDEKPVEIAKELLQRLAEFLKRKPESNQS
jgi:hypothetical protein